MRDENTTDAAAATPHAHESDCGCGPTRTERTALTRRRFIGVGAGATALTALTVGAFGVMSPAFAQIAGYPSWDDVQRAKQNEATKNAEIARINGLIQNLQNSVAATADAAQRAASEYAMAQAAFEDAAIRAQDLQAQADAQAALATEASDKAARVAAQLYRKGGDDTALQLLFSGSADNADELLSRLGGMDKFVERNRDIYAAALAARNNAQALGNQAAAARDERDKRQQEAAVKMQQAQDAAIAAQNALDEQSTYLVQLQAQLAALQDTTATTVAKYQAGVEEERRRKEEAERRAREEALRLAREAEARRQEEERRRQEAAANAGGGSTTPATGGSSGGGGETVSSGWARPSSGWISSWYGLRDTICANGYCTTGHRGIDFATGCGSAIYAASAGRVIWAGPLDSWGNLVRVDHGGGIVTAYAHVQPGGILVSVGQQVSAGDLIAREGRTGLAQGCHLHFEVWRNGVREDPAPFLRARGISV